MDDRQRAQGLKGAEKAILGIRGAGLGFEDILTNGCGCPETMQKALEHAAAAEAEMQEAHRLIRTAHIIKANSEQGSPLPFPEGEEATRAPRKGPKKKGGKAAAAGEDAPGADTE